MTATRKPIETGATFMTPGIQDNVASTEVFHALMRHQAGDWGDCCEADRQANEEALEEGLRLFSVYHDGRGTKFWIITESDRSSTTVLLPEEY